MTNVENEDSPNYPQEEHQQQQHQHQLPLLQRTMPNIDIEDLPESPQEDQRQQLQAPPERQSSSNSNDGVLINCHIPDCSHSPTNQSCYRTVIEGVLMRNAKSDSQPTDELLFWLRFPYEFGKPHRVAYNHSLPPPSIDELRRQFNIVSEAQERAREDSCR